jgi:hypothetical protein
MTKLNRVKINAFNIVDLMNNKMPDDSGILLEIILAVLTRLSALMPENVKPKNAVLLRVRL